ncbi:STY4851/ECs_5259 family protein [Alkalilimnicola ehrlichii]|uniref:STY4851/ECs_5259 family protein n=1 Tax=Alkalilimnicola ehrlichii TaxID=351052 RepID=UPI003B9EAAE9
MGQLKKFMLIHARFVGNYGIAEPDGRPLYSYRCSDQFYQDLRSELAQQIQTVSYGSVPPGFEACFCLYAAETFHREHSGGPWAWKTVFAPLNAPVPSNSAIGRWVANGLAYWKRQLLTGALGQRLALVTIACEGGLPLRLLHKEGAHLRTFFRKILEEHHQREAHASELEAAARRHIRHLPKSLRNEEVVRLAAALIERTVSLQRDIGDATDPITALDEQQPHWRTTLPLRMDDEVASALFKNLVEDSREMARAAVVRPAWLGSLTERAPGQFSVRKELHFPERLSTVQLSEWIGHFERPPARLRLYLDSPHRSEPVAVLTLFARGEDQTLYRREWLQRGGVVLTGASVLEPRDVCLRDGQHDRSLPLHDGAEWGECPWVFVSAPEDGRWRWLSEGSACTRSDEALVVVPETCLPDSPENGTCDYRGSLVEPARHVYGITGTVGFRTEDGAHYRVHCGAGTDSGGAVRLKGQMLTPLLNSQPVFLGVPRFQEDSARGDPGMSAGEMVQWRPYGQGGPWRSADDNCLGRVWLRLVDATSGIERIRRRADVVPHGVQIERHIGTSHQPGAYRLRGIGRADVHVQQPPVARSDYSSEQGTVVLDCAPLPGESLVPLQLELQWPETCPVTLEMPYPQKGAMFQLDGRTLSSDELVTLDRLHGLWLVLQNPSGGERFILDAELMGGSAEARSLRQLGFVENLPPLQRGGLECNLGAWVDQIRSMLASTDDLEAMVRLTVQSQARESLARVRIARFDMVICPVPDSESVFVPAAQLEQLGPDWQSRLSLEALALWSPSDAPRPLTLREDVPGNWLVPRDLTPGPWWIVGRDGNWARFRPLLWFVRSDGETHDGPAAGAVELAAAVRDPDPQQRAEHIDATLQAMGEIPDHPDWNLLLGYVALAKEFPPNSLDVLRHLIRHPRTLAMALLMADDAQFDRLIGFAEGMPFAWGLLPVAEWRRAAVVYFQHLRELVSPHFFLGESASC